MKVNDGYWLIRDGWRFLHPVDVLDVATTADSVTVTSLTRRFTGRGAELNTPTLTVRLSSPAPGVIGVRAAHLLGGRPRTPAFELSPTATTVVVEQDEHRVSLTSGDLTARIDTRTWRVTFEAEGRALTDSGPKRLGAVTDPDGVHHMIERLALGVGEHVYGLGERFTPFVKNGRVIDTWNADGGTASDQAYKAVPFYLSDAGYGVFIASLDRVEFEVASEVVSRVQFTVPGQELEYYVIHSPSPKEVLSRYTALTGRPALPPRGSSSPVRGHHSRAGVDARHRRRAGLHPFGFPGRRGHRDRALEERGARLAVLRGVRLRTLADNVAPCRSGSCSSGAAASSHRRARVSPRSSGSS